jgi:Na+-driven multidrug efflux pump
MVVKLLAYLPVVLAVRAVGPTGSAVHDVVVLWLAFTLFMVVRGAGLWWRGRQDDWMVVGAT